MIVVVYDPEDGQTWPDAKVSEVVSGIVNGYKNEGIDAHLLIGSELMIDEFRLYMCKGLLTPADIQIRYRDEEVIIRPNGVVVEYPEGFCGYQMRVVGDIIRAQVALRRRQREGV